MYKMVSNLSLGEVVSEDLKSSVSNRTERGRENKGDEGMRIGTSVARSARLRSEGGMGTK